MPRACSAVGFNAQLAFILINSPHLLPRACAEGATARKRAAASPTHTKAAAPTRHSCPSTATAPPTWLATSGTRPPTARWRPPPIRKPPRTMRQAGRQACAPRPTGLAPSGTRPPTARWRPPPTRKPPRATRQTGEEPLLIFKANSTEKFLAMKQPNES